MGIYFKNSKESLENLLSLFSQRGSVVVSMFIFSNICGVLC